MKRLSIFFIAKLFIVYSSLFIVYSSLFTVPCFSQETSINTTGLAADKSAMLDISSTIQGILIPRMTTAQRNAIPSPAISLLIYNITTDRLNYYKANGWYELSSLISSTNKGNIITGGGTAINLTGAIADSSAILDINSDTRGFLLPRTIPDSIATPAKGLIIFDNSTNNFKYFNGSNWTVICDSFITNTTGSGSLTSEGIAINITGNTADNSGILDITSSTKGLLIPRMSSTERDMILPKQGLLVFENNTTNSINFSDGNNWYSLVTENLSAPIAGTNIPSDIQIIWNWNKVNGATGYKWNTIDDYKTATATSPAGTSSFTQAGIKCKSSYTLYVWAYNDCGNSSSTTLSDSTTTCITICPGGITSVTDVDGNTYNAIKIGTQCWMKENLKTTKYNNKSAITYMFDGTTWWNTTGQAYYCWFNNDPAFKNTYGALYNWYAANDNRKICPTGWHLPSDADWDTLITYLGGRTIAGGYMKEAGTTHWNSPNTGADNSSGFTALAAGGRNFYSYDAINHVYEYGIFGDFGNYAYFWSSYGFDTYGSFIGLKNDVASVDNGSYYPKRDGFSVRCVKD